MHHGLRRRRRRSDVAIERGAIVSQRKDTFLHFVVIFVKLRQQKESSGFLGQSI